MILRECYQLDSTKEHAMTTADDTDSGTVRPGNPSRVLDAREQHHERRVACLRRDRHPRGGRGRFPIPRGSAWPDRRRRTLGTLDGRLDRCEPRRGFPRLRPDLSARPHLGGHRREHRRHGHHSGSATRGTLGVRRPGVPAARCGRRRELARPGHVVDTFSGHHAGGLGEVLAVTSGTSFRCE